MSEEKGKENIVREPLRETEAKKILETINDEYGINKVADMIKDNKIEFEHEGKNYRVHLLSPKDKDELDFLRRKYFGKLLADKEILFEKDIIRLYEERGIKISELDSDIAKINKQIRDVNFKLGEALANKGGDSILKTYKEELEQLSNEVYTLLIRKGDLLQFSLEQQLQNYVAKVMTFLSLDVKTEEEKWQRAYQNLDDYLSADERLINLSATYSMTLQYRI